MNEEMKNNEILLVEELPRPEDFYGLLTDGYRVLLHRKIEELRVPKVNIARYFDITLQTLHKWEYGPTLRLSASASEKFRPFICGEVDNLVKTQPHPRYGQAYSQSTLPDSIMFCMERISKVYDICAQRPEAGEEFIRKMDKAALSALQELLPPIVFHNKKENNHDDDELKELEKELSKQEI